MCSASCLMTMFNLLSFQKNQSQPQMSPSPTAVPSVLSLGSYCPFLSWEECTLFASGWCASATPGPTVLFHTSMSVVPPTSLWISSLQEVLNTALLLVRVLSILHLTSIIRLSRFWVLHIIKAAGLWSFQRAEITCWSAQWFWDESVIWIKYVKSISFSCTLMAVVSCSCLNYVYYGCQEVFVVGNKIMMMK